MLSFDELKAEVESGAIDTVVVAFTDMQGRLMGKRLHGEFFCRRDGRRASGRGLQLPARARHGDGSDPGLRDRELGARLRRLRDEAGPRRRCGGSRGSRRRRSSSATSLWHDGTPVAAVAAPGAEGADGARRSARLHADDRARSSSSISCARATRRRWAQRYEDLTPSVPYILDYHILATTYDEDLIRQIRNGMHAAGIKVETSKGEAWPGQHEINFRFADALTMADNHVIYKNGAKEIANLNGCSITFMAKPFESWIGNSCHIHASLFRDGEPAFRDDQALFDRFLAGMIALLQGARDLPRPDDQLVQALRGRVLGADDARVGARQPHVRVPARRARRVDAASRRASPAAT